jgi:hypothetical protein
MSNVNHFLNYCRRQTDLAKLQGTLFQSLVANMPRTVLCKYFSPMAHHKVLPRGKGYEIIHDYKYVCACACVCVCVCVCVRARVGVGVGVCVLQILIMKDKQLPFSNSYIQIYSIL